MIEYSPIPENLSFGELQQHLGLGVIPIFSVIKVNQFPYLTLDEALNSEVIRITETSDSGSIPELMLENSAALPIFLMDGEELVGAKQNRVLNLSVLAPANQKIVIPVSCVESGRWRYAREDFKNSDSAHFAKGRAKKMASVSDSLSRSGTRRSDQGEVWSDIDNKICRMRSASATSAMSDIYEQENILLEDYVNSISVLPDQIGAFYFVHGKAIGFDFFDQPATFQKLNRKLLKSYAIDAMEQSQDSNSDVRISEVDKLVNVFRSSEWITYPGTGLGEDFRFSSPQAAGAALVVNQTTIHLSGFKLSESIDRMSDRGLASARMRRRMRTQ